MQATQAAHAQDLANTKKWSLGHVGSIDKNSKSINGIWDDNKKMRSEILQLFGNEKSTTALEGMRAKQIADINSQLKKDMSNYDDV